MTEPSEVDRQQAALYPTEKLVGMLRLAEYQVASLPRLRERGLIDPRIFKRDLAEAESVVEAIRLELARRGLE